MTSNISCPNCDSKNIIKRGIRKNILLEIQLYYCKQCDKTFSPALIKKVKYPSFPTIEPSLKTKLALPTTSSLSKISLHFAKFSDLKWMRAGAIGMLFARRRRINTQTQPHHSKNQPISSLFQHQFILFHLFLYKCCQLVRTRISSEN